jgi:TonB family protein
MIKGWFQIKAKLINNRAAPFCQRNGSWFVDSLAKFKFIPVGKWVGSFDRVMLNIRRESIMAAENVNCKKQTVPNYMDANRKSEDYKLKSELARLSLPAASQDANLKLAWVNSICILFLLIGIVGARRELIAIKPVSPLAEIVPVFVEPMILLPQATTETKEAVEDKNDTPRVVVAIPQSPSVIFSVPTIGSLVVPAQLASAPPLDLLRTAASISSVSSTGTGGERPQPPYPRLALEEGEQGTIILLLGGDTAGNVISVDVKEASGFQILDRATVEFIKQHWHLPASTGNQLFQTRITYKLQLN